MRGIDGLDPSSFPVNAAPNCRADWRVDGASRAAVWSVCAPMRWMHSDRAWRSAIASMACQRLFSEDMSRRRWRGR